MEKYTFITGASSGLGKELAKLYAKDGNNLILVGTNCKRLEETSAETTNTNPNIKVITKACDLSNYEECKKLYNDIKELNVFVNNVVNNAGFGDCCDFKDMDIDTQIKMNHVNCDALLYFSRVFLDDMIKNNEGHIINVSSIASFYSGPYMCTYHSTKAYVTNVSMAIAYELRKTNIKVLTLCPGPFESAFVNKAHNDFTFSKKKPITAAKVASIAYDASRKGKSMVVIGFKNKVELFATRFVSRKFATKSCAKTIKKDI